jgi:hypothetical protein
LDRISKLVGCSERINNGEIDADTSFKQDSAPLPPYLAPAPDDLVGRGSKEALGAKCGAMGVGISNVAKLLKLLDSEINSE